jgi:site-specific DNA-cytosine methylase
MKPKITSLHTRAGRRGLGLGAAGYAVPVCVEIGAEAVATLSENRPRWGVVFAMFPAKGSKS